MANGINLLSARRIDSAKPNEKLNDGGGLMLEVSPKGKASWFLRYSVSGKRSRTKLGSYPGMTLAEARVKRDEAQNWIDQKLDPVEQWAAPEAIQAEKDKALSFGQFTEQQLPRIVAKYENPKHRQQWVSTLYTYAKPKPIWNTPIGDVDQNHVAEVIVPIWRSRRETANRVRGRIETLINIASARSLYEKRNPAAWAIQKHIVPELTKAERKERNHPAMDYERMPEYWANLEAREVGPARDCLQMCILTALRPSEIREGRWDEIDLEKREWNIPGPRMKLRKAHTIPITNQMLEILMRQPSREGYIFRNPMKGNCLSNMAMLSLLKRMGDQAINSAGQRVTVHGCRSSFTDWLGDATEYDENIAEHQQARAVQGAKGHYRRRTSLDKRRKVMQVYADYVSGKREMKALPTNVVSL